MLVPRWRISLILCSFLFLCAVWPQESTLNPAVATGRLLTAVSTDSGDVVYKVWVRFVDRGLSGPDLDAALTTAEANLIPRAARRRAKMHAPGERLVDVRDLPLNPERLAACRATGAQLHQQSRWLNAASFRATAAQVARLTHLSGVRQVDLVAGLHRAAVPRPVGEVAAVTRLPHTTVDKAGIDYGANQAAMVQANVLPAHQMGLTGHGVVVGMLDTGFRTTHEALAGIPVLDVWDFVNNDGNVDNEGTDPSNANTHGTMTLSTVAGNMPGQLVAPAFGASVVLAKTEDVAVEVPLEEDNWVAGLEWAEALGADIISSSLGYLDWYVAEDLDGNTAVTTIAADLAVARGLVVVNSAGNERGTSGLLIAPADADSVITVGAVDAADTTSWFSSPGPTADGRIKPDVAALGVSNTVVDPTDDMNYLTASGTSFSCPLTSGVVALILERVPCLTPLQVREALRSTASHPASPDTDQGWGIIDAAAAATWFGPVISHTPLDSIAGPPAAMPVVAVITDRLGLDAGSLHYRIDGGVWQDLPLLPTGQPDEFSADIPAIDQIAQVEYYLTATSVNAVATSFPYAGAAEPFSFLVDPVSAVGDDRLPTLTRLFPNVPNPFNPQTALSFSLTRSGPVLLEVFDLRGRLVRTLLDTDLTVGTHTVVWNGRDQTGRSVSSGTYLCRLRAADQVQQRKMQLVR